MNLPEYSRGFSNKKAVGLKIVASICLFSLLSCETKIDPALENADALLVVDAWVNNKPGNQVITLTKTQSYFDSSLPPAVTGANVTVVDNAGKVFAFNEDPAVKGNYVWKPVGNERLGVTGTSFKLTIQAEGEVYEASSKMGRTPQIDTLILAKNEPEQTNPEFYFAEFIARDFAGAGDTYWIRATKNGVLLNKPSDLNVAYDAGFSAGGKIDGFIFITPIRRGINPNDTDANDAAVSPYVPGDSVYVEINSITVQAFDYLQQVQVQTDRPGGFGELFARPLSNVSTNIVNVNKNGKKALGFFNVAAVSGRGQRFKKN
ncbi:MAG: DUF4249 domain-containing protein [Cytophagales bacterium]|jgi:hypothetical protein|nr:DUF4249 domain-containing protein [Cytophagales bacterium]MCA6388050.1 DUF4249 domain-containing protein [Cytophagales bacterium]MCA6391079.1 DUF4249 domain-containing protein [Cytophagales bacterium]MCA6394800.1 DUF4249 domain-containing protein [Cytophagales bacterium]MCA6399821.1 DUF4249 domain-containing protein [Cytophagales bacterium]